jgi:hypothetical protein
MFSIGEVLFVLSVVLVVEAVVVVVLTVVLLLLDVRVLTVFCGARDTFLSLVEAFLRGQCDFDCLLRGA